MTIASSTQFICFVALSAAVAIGALGVVLLLCRVLAQHLGTHP